MKKFLVVLLLLATSVFANNEGRLQSMKLALAGKTASIDSINPDEQYIIMNVDSGADSTEGTFYTMPINMFDYGALKVKVDCYRIQERDTGGVFFPVVGTGTNDLVHYGTYTGSALDSLFIKITAEGTPDSVRWVWGDTGAWDSASLVDSGVVTDTLSVGNGKYVIFGGTDTHDDEDVFKLFAYPGGYASSYTGYSWNDTTPGSTAISIQPQTYDLFDDVQDVATAVVATDTGVTTFWLGKGDGFLGSDSLGAEVRLKIRIRDSLGNGAQDTAHSQYKYFFNIVAQRKR